MTDESKKWVIINTAILISWLIVFVANLPEFILNLQSPSPDQKVLINFIITLVILFTLPFCYFVKFKFILYALICLIMGFFSFYIKQDTVSLLTMLVSILFVWRQKICGKKTLLILLAIISLLPVMILLVIKAEIEVFFSVLSNEIAVILLIVLTLFLLFPIYSKNSISIKRSIDLQSLRLNPRQIEVLKQMLLATKYNVIANNLGISIATVKRDAAVICDALKVADRTELLTKYQGITISSEV